MQSEDWLPYIVLSDDMVHASLCLVLYDPGCTVKLKKIRRNVLFVLTAAPYVQASRY